MVTLTKSSLEKLKGVHPDLVMVVTTAVTLSEIGFIVTEGVRTIEKQKQLVAAGASRTLNSRHIPSANGFAHAVDLAAMVANTVRWDWPLYAKIADAMKQAAKIKNTPLEWGGDWRTFKDGPHFQLPFKAYP